MPAPGSLGSVSAAQSFVVDSVQQWVRIACSKSGVGIAAIAKQGKI